MVREEEFSAAWNRREIVVPRLSDREVSEIANEASGLEPGEFLNDIAARGFADKVAGLIASRLGGRVEEDKTCPSG